jgi:pimeloyl-ACP methyl ester carboxylesterase
VWVPNDYACTTTDRPGLQHVAVLEQMLRDYKAKHPKAHFSLVGHSLGGYVTFLAGARDATRTAEERLDIDSVVTLDAPLLGASADKKTILDLVSCDKTYQAGGELVTQRADPGTPALRASQAQAMHDDGVRLATFGNTKDCLWATVRCIGGTWIDDTDTQFLAGAELSASFDVDAELLASHDSILAHQPAIDQLVSFVGAP